MMDSAPETADGGPDPDTGEARALTWSRAALGLLFLLRTTPLLAPLHIPFLADAVPLLAWPDGGARFAPALLPPLPDRALAAACIVRTLAALVFALGVAARPAGLIAGALGFLTVEQDPARDYATFHVLFLGTMLLALASGGGRWTRRAHAAGRGADLFIVRAWTASIYLWAGVAKLRADWLDGRTLALFRDEGAFRPALTGLLLATPGRCAALACSVVAVELALPPLLLWRRTRRGGLALALALHAAFEIAASPDLFGWIMAALLITFWRPRGGEATDRAAATPTPTQ